MKKVSIVCLAGILFFGSCRNNSSSTQGSYESPEETSSTEKMEESEAHEKEEPAKTDAFKTDTVKTTIQDTSKMMEH